MLATRARMVRHAGTILLCDRVSSSRLAFEEFPLSLLLSPPAIKEYLRDFCGNKKKRDGGGRKERRGRKGRGGEGEMRGDRSRHVCVRTYAPWRAPRRYISSFSTRPFENNRAQWLLERSYLLYLYMVLRIKRGRINGFRVRFRTRDVRERVCILRGLEECT